MNKHPENASSLSSFRLPNFEGVSYLICISISQICLLLLFYDKSIARICAPPSERNKTLTKNRCDLALREFRFRKVFIFLNQTIEMLRRMVKNNTIQQQSNRLRQHHNKGLDTTHLMAYSLRTDTMSRLNQ
ncbi:hypothetical protein KIN20_038435 [Parelaphostrongylus tenuis]|uniref:Uncharacterized protein n=1 Tax=Parelaphostrongylus tenuis TaxID=148309 RepID=A0AAD5QYF8_PARTN|nr:hypothetical protein KIN20_038435 [Parelaphostrongylus tenuis]